MRKLDRQMLVVSPHPDDSILGAGGTMARYAHGGGQVTVLTMAAHMPPLYSDADCRRTVAEAKKAHAVLGVAESMFLNRPALSLAQCPQYELNKDITDIMIRLRPSLLLIPYLDRNEDHRAVFESAMVAARPTGPGRDLVTVAAYECLSSTHYNAPHIEPNFMPNWTVDISDFMAAKVQALRCCESQTGAVPHPRSPDALSALALFRGSQAGVHFGEAFCIIRSSAAPEILVRQPL